MFCIQRSMKQTNKKNFFKYLQLLSFTCLRNPAITFDEISLFFSTLIFNPLDPKIFRLSHYPLLYPSWVKSDGLPWTVEL